jgi:PKD repeat protein
MKKNYSLIAILTLILISQLSFGQNQSQRFKMEGINPENITINETFTSDVEIFPFEKNVNKVFGVAVSAEIVFENDNSLVRLIFVDKDYKEHLIYEAHPLLESTEQFSVEEICEETAILNGLKAHSVKIEITDAQINLKSLTYSKALGQGVYSEKNVKEKKHAQNEEKVKKINKNLQEKGLHWVAGPTEVSELTYAERKQLYGQSTFPAGFEYYAGGVISTSTTGGEKLKSATASSPFVDDWDWRNRHGKNWITPVTNQSSCGSCWAFAATGAVEAMVNLFFNQQLNLNLSEQDILSCSGAGDCNGGLPSTSLNYIVSTGIVDEGTFPYTATYQACVNKGTNPSERIKIAGKVDFGSITYPRTDDDLKRMLIEMGPVSGGLYDWSHAMVLVGYKVVKEGDKFYYRDLDWARSWKTVAVGDPLIGKTVWIFKNSWGPYFGDAGYVYVETPITNIGWTHSIKTPVTSAVKNYQVICEDKDGDGYFWWGLGTKPATCNCPDQPDGNDADPKLGPIDQYGNCMVIGIPPIANFTSNKTEITEGETITFTDLSSNALSWSWVFEGGNPTTSNLKNPTVTYNTPGIYDVTLVVSNANGSNIRTIENSITVKKIIRYYCTSYGNATEDWISSVQVGTHVNISGSAGSTGYEDFTTSVMMMDAGITQPFTLTPKFAATAKNQFWRIWIDFNEDMDFDDAGENVYTSSYSSVAISGSFKIPENLNITTRMRVSMKRNATSSPCEKFTYGEVEDYLIKIGTWETQSPIANFSADKTSVTEGGSVNFSDLSTNTPTTWAWTFAGGNPGTSSSKNPVVTYSTAGTYTVTLVATNSSGSNTKSVTNYITVVKPVVAPVANFSADKTTVTEGGTVTFADLSTNTPTVWAWTFTGGTPGTSSSKNPVVTYSNAGTYAVALTATNASGSNTKTVAGYITVVKPVVAPVADFSADKTSVTEGSTVTFSDLSTNIPSAWSWTFAGGNPGTSSSKNPVVTYNTAGTYTVTLVATNASGSNTKTVTNYIIVTKPVLAPVANFSASKTVITKGETVIFSDLSTNTPTSWSWNFAGGTPLTSTLQNPAVTYSTAGTYKVVLTATNSAGSNTKTVENYIQVNEPVLVPVAEFEAVKTSVFVGENVQLTDLSENAPTQWEWLFPGGNPSISSEQNPKVTYNAAGEYDVTLTVSKPGVASSKKTKSRYIITVQNIPADYCKPVAISSTPDFISSVVIGNVLNSTSSGSGYSLSGNLVSLAPGKSYSVTLTPNVSTNRNFWKIWIDFNSDYDFNDAGENVVTVSNKKGAAKTSFTVPQYATGTTRMRIAMRTLVALGECDDNYKGEVEDYPVLFEMAASSGNETPEITASLVTDSQDINELSEIIATAVENVAFEISDSFKCYPNPVNHLLNVQLYSAQQGDFYTVYNINGGKVVSGQIISTLTTVNFENYSPGIYLLRIVNGERVFNERIIKK